MGRYGISTKPTSGNGSSFQDGHDEVDNAMSKLDHAHSPSPTRRKVKPRRNSLTQSAVSDLLSEDDDFSNDEMDKQNRSNKSNQSQNGTIESHHLPSHQLQHESTNRSHNESYEFRSTHRSPEPDTNHENGSISIAVKVAAFAAIVAAFIWFYLNQIPRVDKNEKYDETLFSIDLIKLGEKYRISQDSILQVQSGIATIFDREDTGSFIFVYNSESQNFNKVHFENFIHDVASTAAKYLRNHSTNVHHIVLESKYLNMKSHSDLMNLYRQEVDKTGVMLVKELENVPSNLAMAFHYYCDEYNPLVKKSAIFFTLDLGKCTSSDTGQKSVSKTSHGVIEKCLTKKWQSVPVDNIKPLLTRVVNIVVDVYSLF